MSFFEKIKENRNMFLAIGIVVVAIGGTALVKSKMHFLSVDVDGISMENTIHDGDKLKIDTSAYKKKFPEYKDLVVVDKVGENKDICMVKRVIGLPGDTIKIEKGIMYKNGEKIEEDYIKEPMSKLTFYDTRMKVPDGKIVVMGDNRNRSNDSRDHTIGFIDVEKNVLGKVINK